MTAMAQGPWPPIAISAAVGDGNWNGNGDGNEKGNQNGGFRNERVSVL
jgi:hypothetical protein